MVSLSLNELRYTSKKVSKPLCHWPFAREINPLVTGGFPSQRASNMENVSMSWHLRVICMCVKEFSLHQLGWWHGRDHFVHYIDVIMSPMASQITGISIGYSSVCSGADQRKYQTSASLSFVTGPLCREFSGHKFPAQIASNAENVSIWWLIMICGQLMSNNVVL